ncbi:MAG: CHRD domain-containing protein [Pseudomonadota bacterium]
MKLPTATALSATVLIACLTASTANAGHTNIVLQAPLDGRQEVANNAKDNRIVGDPRGRGEAYVFGIDANTTTLCYLVEAAGIGELSLAPGGGRQAHIHRGRKGENGPVVVTIAWPQDGRSADCIAENRILPNGSPAFSRDPATGQPRATVFEILMNPEQFYVNVHNAEYPAGAIRGQLKDTLEP